MPHRKPPLPAEQIARLAAWIDAGVPGSDDAAASSAGALESGRPLGLREAGAAGRARGRARGVGEEPHRRVRPGAAREGGPVALARGLARDARPPPQPRPRRAAPDARRRSTRSSPTRGPDAYERVVDRLLASPHFGERWARPWLDLARYADTNGYEKDQRRTAWKYRDWVIDALNRDLSFRDFTIEQLAGDMLPGATLEQRIATGFHRNTQLNQEGGIDVEEARFETLVDRVNTTGTVWLGTTVGCAQCHNHKFDPVSQKDYYRMLAFYDNAEYSVYGQGEEIVDRWIVEPDLELPTPEQAKRREALRREADSLRLRDRGARPRGRARGLRAGGRGKGAGVECPRAASLRGGERGFPPEAARRLAPRLGRGQGQGPVHRHGSRPDPRDHGVPARGASRPVVAAEGPGPLELGRLRGDRPERQREGRDRAARPGVRRRQREAPGGVRGPRPPRRDRVGRHRRRVGRASARPRRPGGDALPGEGRPHVHPGVPVRLAARAVEPRPLPPLGDPLPESPRRPARAGRGAADPRRARLPTDR